MWAPLVLHHLTNVHYYIKIDFFLKEESLVLVSGIFLFVKIDMILVGFWNHTISKFWKSHLPDHVYFWYAYDINLCCFLFGIFAFVLSVSQICRCVYMVLCVWGGQSGYISLHSLCQIWGSRLWRPNWKCHKNKPWNIWQSIDIVPWEF